MNYYYLSLFVILLGPWVISKEIPHNSTLNSLGKERVVETKKKLTGEGSALGIFMGQIVSPAKAFLQSLRRLLKIIRKWCRSHPLEVKLAKCFASYFNIKIPGLRRYDQLEGYDGNIGGLKQNKWQTSESEFVNVPTNKSESRTIVLTIPKYLNNIIESIKTNHLVICSWDYITKRFWTWVDAAPDS